MIPMVIVFAASQRYLTRGLAGGRSGKQCQDEAMAMATRIAVMNGGAIQQVGAPLDVYRRPVNRFVATFLGNPKMNVLDGRVERRDEQPVIAGPGYAIAPLAERRPALEAYASSRVIMGIRPEALTLAPSPATTEELVGRVEVVEPLGSRTILQVAVNGHQVVAEVGAEDTVATGDTVRLRIDSRHDCAFDPESERALW